VKTGIPFPDLLILDPCLRRDDKTGQKPTFAKVEGREEYLEVTPLKGGLPVVASGEGGGIGGGRKTSVIAKAVSKSLFLVL
jgi:hypothetical protein